MNEFMKNFSLEGKIAFVTGASYGIGFAIANALSAAARPSVSTISIKIWSTRVWLPTRRRASRRTAMSAT